MKLPIHTLRVAVLLAILHQLYLTARSGFVLSGSSTSTSDEEPGILPSRGDAGFVAMPSAMTETLFNQTIVPAVHPLWNCNDTLKQRRHSKLAFVHVFKTAGSTLRDFFIDYSKVCGARYATLIHCTPVSPEDFRKSDSWKKCVLKLVTNQKGLIRGVGKPVVKNQWLQQHVDMIGGHFRIGTADHLVDSNGKPFLLKYITFVRNAAAKYVSGVVQVHVHQKHLPMTEDDLVKKMKKDVTSYVKHGRYHNKYSHYLLTPWQVREYKNMSFAATNQLIKENLVSYNVTVGVVERMTESMELLQHLIDSEKSAQKLFDAYSGKPATNSSLTNATDESGKRKNKGKISTTTLLRRLQEDEAFYPKLLEYVKYEQDITDFATNLHMGQYQAMQSGGFGLDSSLVS